MAIKTITIITQNQKRRNKKMEKENIKLGEISEEELVKAFGSDAQKKSYEENGRFIGNYKNALLKKMSRYCNIKESKKRTYEISEVYEYPLPSNFNKMNKSLYKYIVPLLLNSLINGHDKNNKIDITIGRWAREINMVNKNYSLVKSQKEATSKEIQYPLETINEFYNKADDMIDWYITNALDYLKSAGLIIWRDVYRINKEVSDEKITIDENGTVYADISIESHQASKDEMDFYSKCIDIADKEANISNESERYYSKKSRRFNEVLKRELYKEKIKCVYMTYEAYYINLDKCNYLLSKFGSLNIEDVIKDFNQEFTDMLIENAGKRFDKQPGKYIYHHDKDDYKLCFQGLCEMTIDKDTEFLGYRIKKKTIEDDYKLQIQEGQ